MYEQSATPWPLDEHRRVMALNLALALSAGRHVPYDAVGLVSAASGIEGYIRDGAPPTPPTPPTPPASPNPPS